MVAEAAGRCPASLATSVLLSYGDVYAILDWKGTSYFRRAWNASVPLGAGDEPAMLREMADAVRAVRWPTR